MAGITCVVRFSHQISYICQLGLFYLKVCDSLGTQKLWFSKDKHLEGGGRFNWRMLALVEDIRTTSISCLFHCKANEMVDIKKKKAIYFLKNLV